jgi:hypothetical protein
MLLACIDWPRHPRPQVSTAASACVPSAPVLAQCQCHRLSPHCWIACDHQSKDICIPERARYKEPNPCIGLQEHRIIEYTATGQEAKPKEHISTEITGTGQLSKLMGLP